MTTLSRRRFLSISAACAALPTLSHATPGPVAHWRGRALGAQASMQIRGLSQSDADPIFAAVEDEVLRLESIFSLYRGDSEISLVNRDGVLQAPSHEFLQVLSLSDRLYRASDGAFDPSIQPLWLAHAQGQSGAPLNAARAAVGWDSVHFDASEVRFGRKGQGLTLNGVAQGFVTDRVAALLRRHGLRDVLVDLGEIAALGDSATGPGWKAGVADTAGEIVARVQLRDRALATSSPMGTRIADRGHILTPAGDTAPRQLVSVSAPQAAVADGLSTALCLLPPGSGEAMIADFNGARLEFSA